MSILKALSSPRLAAILIAVLLGLCLISFLIPQLPQAELMLHSQWAQANPTLAEFAKVTQLDDVFASPLFIGVLVLLAVNLTACTIRRAPRAVKRASRMGSLIMHAGLLLLILGGVVSALTRFTGTIALTEGQTLSDVRSSYVDVAAEPKMGNAFTGASLGLDSLEFDYEKGFITQARAKLSFAQDGESKSVETVVNRPARWDGKYYLLTRGGHAVGLSVTGRNGVLVDDSFVRLGTAMSDGSADTLPLADGRQLEMVTAADRSKKNPYLERLKLTDPAVRFRVNKQGPGVWLRPGESGRIDDLTISVSDIRLWTEFSARKDAGIPLVYLAFGVITLGAGVRFGVDKKRERGVESLEKRNGEDA